MHSAGYEWAAYVARVNEVEVARAGTPASPRTGPASPRLGTVALSAVAGAEARPPEIGEEAV